MQKNRKKDKSIPFRTLPVIVFIFTLIGVLLVSLIRSNAEKWFPPQKCKISLNDAKAWLQAVKTNDMKKAILLAKKMVSDDIPKLPNPDYLSLLLKLKISSLILTSPFNKYDFIRWKDSVEMQNIVTNISKTNDNIPNVLFKNMTDRIKPIFKKDKNYSPTISIFEIWNKKTASIQDQCRLFAALTRQAGYDVQIVSIYSKEGNLLHIVCELRKNSESYIADPRFHKIWKDASVAKFANNNSLVADIWPPKIIKSLNRRIYKLPAEPQDYKTINVELHRKLKALGLSHPPLFGQDPMREIDRYIKKYQKKNTNDAFSYWTFPFHSLMSSPGFPEDWKLKKGSLIGD